jgi:glycosyltransferase involved in cell wall biosynthesis
LQRLQRLSQWGHEVRVFCPDYRSLAAIYPNWEAYTGEILPGVTVVNLPSTSFMGVEFERNVSWRAHPLLWRELLQFSPQIIHVDEPERLFVGLLRFPGVAVAKQLGVPCVSFFRTNFLEYVDDFFPLPPLALIPLKGFLKGVIVRTYNAYDLTLVASPITHQKLVQMGIQNTRYAPLLGCDTDKFHPSLRRAGFFEQAYGLPQVDGTVKLVFLGRLTPDKGWQFTMEAFTQLVQQVDPTRVSLLIAGDGAMAEEIQQRLGALVPQVHLLGRVPPDDVPALLANGDIHVTTSEKETRGLTVLEAFAAGIPVIAPRAGGVVENMQDGWNGFLFTPQDQKDFVTKLQTLIDDSDLRQTMGRHARDCVADFSWDAAVKQLVDIWEFQLAHGLPP